jgi:CheY-like chemotaxis protein
MDVLLVEPDESERTRLSEVLAAEGHRVMTCPGPTRPDYTCVGDRLGRCPLIEPAVAMVLDLRLPGEALLTGTTAAELLTLYVSWGRPVVAIGGASSDRDLYGGQVVFVRPCPDADELIGAVMRLPIGRMDL